MKKVKRNDLERVFLYLEERFGIKRTVLESYDFRVSTKGKIFLSNRFPRTDTNPVLNLGLPFARISRSGVIKPTSVFIQLFGRHARKGVVSLDKEQAKRFASGRDPEIGTDVSRGYVIVRYGKYDLGCGHLKEGVLKNMLPKGKRMNVELL